MCRLRAPSPRSAGTWAGSWSRRIAVEDWIWSADTVRPIPASPSVTIKPTVTSRNVLVMGPSSFKAGFRGRVATVLSGPLPAAVHDRIRDPCTGWGVLAESERMQELVNEQDLSALCLHRKLEEPLAAHVNHPASRLGERGYGLVGATLNRVITLDEAHPSQQA